MNELIKIAVTKIGETEVQAFNGRELHSWLGSSKDYSSWAKDQIVRAKLVKDIDYSSVTLKGGAIINDLEGLRPGLDYSVEYYFTIDAGKDIGMMSATEKGMEVRAYFRECEREAKQNVKPLSPMEMVIASAQAILRLEQEQARQAKEILELKAKQTVAGDDFYTVAGWFALEGRKCPGDKVLADIGRKCSKLSRSEGLEPGTASSVRFGKVGTYHVSIIARVVAANKY